MMVSRARILFPFAVVGSAYGFIVLFKDKMGGPLYDKEVSIAGHTVIVTGANTGIGKEVSKDLAKRGGKIIMACRDMEKCEEAKKEVMEFSYNKKIYCKKLDLASLKSVRDFADDINKNEERLHVLVNNAGVMGCPKETTIDGFERHIAVNFLGPYLLTTLLLDKLKKSQPSRIINTTTLAIGKGHIAFRDFNSDQNYNAKDAYIHSKLAFSLFSYELAQRLEGSGVNVYTVHPGVVKTDLGRHLQMNKSYLSGPILGPIWSTLFKTPREGAQTTVYCAVDPDLEDKNGQFYLECGPSEFPKNAAQDDLSKKIWTVGEKWTDR